ncbi:hypothetical protein LRR81_12295 [Metabacillus sp. GX 13764]|uniref:hypothetical protein n=1 Tax=Metabacillus kandeliae TaxID=2900151 RepID=UPI001E3AFBE6|nr:hypothetical protein [Metabacillus kandeliae]MCD7035028.1 hypothetical protein [Metabacillus kandeliae]
MMKKPIVTLSAALILVLSAGCQSQQSTQSSPKQENTQKEPQSQIEQKEEGKQETPAAGQQDQEKANTETNGNAGEGSTDGNSQKADQETGTSENEKDSGSTSDSQSAENADQTAENPDVPYMSPFELREELQLGMTKQQVGDLLQNSNPAEVKGENGDTLSRYDYMAHDGAKPADDKEYDADALKSDKLEAQIDVKWDQDGKAESFTIYHKNDDGHILKYHSDSSIQEETTAE